MLGLVTLQPAYILHARPYRETSLLLDIFTREYGRIAAVAKGVRSRKSNWKALLQPFYSVTVSWSGRGELVALREVEAHGASHFLQGKRLFCGLYLNELLVKLLHRDDPHPVLFDLYQQTLRCLQQESQEQICLRLFEKGLLRELGYGLVLDHDVMGYPIQAERYYRFQVEEGFVPIEENESSTYVFSGKGLLAFGQEQFDLEVLREAKRLTRLALDVLLAGKNLKVRELIKN